MWTPWTLTTPWQRYAIWNCVTSLLVTWLTKKRQWAHFKDETQGVRVFDWISRTNRSCFVGFLVFLVFLSFLNLEVANSNNCPSESFLSPHVTTHERVKLTTWSPSALLGSFELLEVLEVLESCARALPRIALLASSGRVWGWRLRRLRSLRRHMCDARDASMRHVAVLVSRVPWLLSSDFGASKHGWEETTDGGKHVMPKWSQLCLKHPETRNWFLTLPRHSGSAIPIGSNGHQPSTK